MASVTAGARRHRVILQGGVSLNDPDTGGYTETWANLNPARVWASITPATARDLERIASATTIATASHLVVIPYHPQVTTHSRILFGTRVFNVTGVANPEERNIELILACVEIEGAPPTLESWIESGWFEA
jgi:SPP1 family predicted phage head-tail adaptor